MLKRILSLMMVFTIVLSLFAGISCTSAVDQPTIRKGSKSKAVGTAQHMLNVIGEAGCFELDEPLVEDNDFGSATRRAVISFQQAFDLDPDGVIGKKTWAALYESYDEVTAAQEDDEALSVSVKNLNIPDHLYQYEVFELEGTLRSDRDLGTVYVGIYDLAGGKINVAKFTGVGETLNLSKVNEKITLSDTKPGDYYFMVLANDDSGRGLEEIVCQELEILDFYVETDFEDTESRVLRFSKRDHGNFYISEHFRVKEFACKGTGKYATDTVLIDRRLVAILEKIRNHFDTSVVITSGYRSQEYNASLEDSGSASKSKHIEGKAADISVKGVDPYTVAAYAQRIGVKGIGYYPSGEGYFTHVDSRSEKSFWKDVGNRLVSVKSFN